MTAVCPAGHTSQSDDYCDVCGMPIGAGAATAEAAAPPPPTDAPTQAPAQTSRPTQSCPNCGTPNVADALFCEACGYDFTTGTMPRQPDAAAGSGDTGAGEAGPSVPLAPATTVEWVAEVWVDPDWYAAQESEDPCPSPGLPAVVVLAAKSVLIGRPSASRNIHPEIDCTGDSGVSRRQAQLTTDGQRWWVEDLQSSNGTYVGPASGPLPTDPVAPGQRRELSEDDRIYVGAWTRLVVRRATPEEQRQLP
jgi:hypothetical protein